MVSGCPLRLHDKKLMNAPSFKEFYLKKFTDPPVSRSSIENCRGEAPAIFPQYEVMVPAILPEVFLLVPNSAILPNMFLLLPNPAILVGVSAGAQCSSFSQLYIY